jgi:hypothetical protein
MIARSRARAIELGASSDVVADQACGRIAPTISRADSRDRGAADTHTSKGDVIEGERHAATLIF